MTVQNDLMARDNAGHHSRSTALVDYEFRDTEGASEWTFEGVACTVDHPYSVRDWMGEFTETIADGAFKRTLNDPHARISLHVNHQHGKAVPLATRTAGTLDVGAEPDLLFRARLDPQRPDVQILRSALKRGEMTEMSIGFADVKGGFEWNSDYTERTVTDLRLREGSIVEDGCNDLTSASIRSLAEELGRFNYGNADEAEIQRAIQFLTGLLTPESATALIADKVIEDVRESGLIVTDEFIEATRKRHWRPVA